MKKNNLSATIMVRLLPEDLSAIDAIQARVPLLSRAAVAREAMRIGLREISRGDPAQLLVGTERRKKRRGRREPPRGEP